MSLVTILGALLVFGVLFFRGKKQLTQPTRRTPWQRFKTAKLLWVALAAWLLLSLQLRRLNHALDSAGAAPYEMSTWDRIVEKVTK